MVNESNQVITELLTAMQEPDDRELNRITVTRACIDMAMVARRAALGAVPAAVITRAISLNGGDPAPALAATAATGIIWGMVQVMESRRRIDRSLRELRRHYLEFRSQAGRPRGETTRIIERPGEPTTIVRIVPQGEEP